MRDKKGVKDSTVADALGITKSTFTGWKQGTLRPNTEKLYKIAGYFDTTIEYLLTGREPGYKDEYQSEYDCSEEDFRLVKIIKNNRELHNLVEIEKELSGEKLTALYNVVTLIDKQPLHTPSIEA